MADSMPDPRPVPRLTGDERPMLSEWLERHRATLRLKCAGLTTEQLRLRSAPPSTMSLLGLVRHMAEVERNWFRRIYLGEEAPSRYYSPPASPDGAFDDVDTADPAEAFAYWEQECDYARSVVAAAESLETTGSMPHGGPLSDETVSLRWIMVHMIEEYARHNGHADLLRERIDGSTGA